MSNVKITDVRAILTCPVAVNLLTVKIETNQPGLYGVGCATFTQRVTVVLKAVEDYLKPLLVGRDVDCIEDTWQFIYGNSYWRNGPVLNNAISGVDEALWDIKGKMANMPVYQLLGGKCRAGIPVYRHADGVTKEEVLENVQNYMEQGYRYIRAQQGTYGGNMLSCGIDTDKPFMAVGGTDGLHLAEKAPMGAYFEPRAYMNKTFELFDYLRDKLGFGVELLHDVHERLSPVDAVAFAKEMEQYKLFFLEDVLPPEQIGWFRMLRSQCATPIAMGELFNNPNEWTPLISERLIDFIRIHISQMGGLTPAKKLASACEMFGVRTAWHGPNDITPIGVAAHAHVDFTTPSFGIQEFAGFTEQEREVFPGCPEVRDGYLYLNDAPGLGVDIDEKAAAKYPYKKYEDAWLWARLPDGSSVRA